MGPLYPGNVNAYWRICKLDLGVIIWWSVITFSRQLNFALTLALGEKSMSLLFMSTPSYLVSVQLFTLISWHICISCFCSSIVSMCVCDVDTNKLTYLLTYLTLEASQAVHTDANRKNLYQLNPYSNRIDDACDVTHASHPTEISELWWLSEGQQEILSELSCAVLYSIEPSHMNTHMNSSYRWTIWPVGLDIVFECFFLTGGQFFIFVCFCMFLYITWLLFGCHCQQNRLPGNIHLQNDLLRVKLDVKLHSLTH